MHITQQLKMKRGTIHKLVPLYKVKQHMLGGYIIEEENTVRVLQQLCKAEMVSDKGTKQELLERIGGIK